MKVLALHERVEHLLEPAVEEPSVDDERGHPTRQIETARTDQSDLVVMDRHQHIVPGFGDQAVFAPWHHLVTGLQPMESILEAPGGLVAWSRVPGRDRDLVRAETAPH
ncbi:MAG: hypothetical protein VYE68_06175 [Acidobacteriota bacterium]|nr:hypothetical protein [Acidobacteriota bacterium]